VIKLRKSDIAARRISISLLLMTMTTTTIFMTSRLRASSAMFAKDSFTLSASAGYARSLDKDEADIGAIEFGGNYFIWDNFSLGAEIAGHGISQLGDDPYMLALEATLRHHFWQRDDWTIFIDGAFGPSYATRDAPQGGTHFNFLSRIGLGATYRLDEHLHLMFGARYWHLSNARFEGVDRNPNFNAVEGYVGLMWQF
jgi:hypothetical protein